MLNSKIAKKMKYLGMDISPKVFTIMRLVSSFILFMFLLFFCNYGYIVSPVVTLIYYFFLEYVSLDAPMNKRIKELEEASLEYFPVLLLVLKNSNVKKSIILATEQVDNVISKEFNRVLNDVKLGKSLDEALTLMKDRIPSIFVSNIIVNLIEANRMGTNVVDNINDQLDYIDDKRKKKIIKYHRIMPLKVALVSMIFVFSILFLLIFCSL